MKTRLITFWERLRASYWFIPALMVIVASVLALLTTALDRSLDLDTSDPLLPYVSGPEGARTLLSTVAGSMITIAGVTFSITIAALSQAASQLGPRLLANFMRDRGNQIVLGTYVATFMYCLLVLRSVRSADENVFVPGLSVTFSLVMAVLSVGVLIYFFHHVSSMMQAENIIASVGRDLEASIARLFPEQAGWRMFEFELRSEDDIPEGFAEEAQAIDARRSGYVQVIDHERLVAIATEHDLLLRALYHAGDFVGKGSQLVLVWPAEHAPDDLDEAVNEAFVLGSQRLRVQDVEYAINQLVEIALRALSPGINDPFTAMACIDQLGAMLAQLVERTIPSGYQYDENAALRLIRDTTTFTGVIDAAFNQIRQHGSSNVAVTIRLLEALAIIAPRARTHEQRQALKRQAMMIRRGSEAIPEENDRRDIEERYQFVMETLEGKRKKRTGEPQSTAQK